MVEAMYKYQLFTHFTLVTSERLGWKVGKMVVLNVNREKIGMHYTKLWAIQVLKLAKKK